jgi:hypothetical protein
MEAVLQSQLDPQQVIRLRSGLTYIPGRVASLQKCSKHWFKAKWPFLVRRRNIGISNRRHFAYLDSGPPLYTFLFRALRNDLRGPWAGFSFADIPKSHFNISSHTTLTSTLQNPRSHPLYAAGRLEEISGGSREADASIESYIRNRGIHWCRRTVEHAPTSTGPPVQVCGGLAYTASIRAFGWTHHAMIGIQTMDLP